MQHFMNLETDSELGADMLFDAIMVTAYVEPTEVRLLGERAMGPRTAERLRTVRKVPFYR